MNKKKWVITTSGDRSLKEIKENLTDVGFDVEETFEEIGCLIGSADDETVKKSLNIQGITDVSPEQPEINIGPPNSPITW